MLKYFNQSKCSKKYHSIKFVLKIFIRSGRGQADDTMLKLVFQIYIPSSLIVVISWVSFWFNRGASVARVNLGVTTVLTMTTLIASTNAALPKVSYVKSIDVYLGACFFLVFTSLLGNTPFCYGYF